MDYADSDASEQEEDDPMETTEETETVTIQEKPPPDPRTKNIQSTQNLIDRAHNQQHKSPSPPPAPEARPHRPDDAFVRVLAFDETLKRIFGAHITTTPQGAALRQNAERLWKLLHNCPHFTKQASKYTESTHMLVMTTLMRTAFEPHGVNVIPSSPWIRENMPLLRELESKYTPSIKVSKITAATKRFKDAFYHMIRKQKLTHLHWQV